MRNISQADHERISEAIAAVEETTSGEIYCVLARRSENYFYASTVMVLVGVFFASAIAVLISDHYWSAPHPATLVTIQATVAAVVIGFLRFLPDLRIYLVPRAVLYRRAHRKATEQFLARNIHLTSRRTGVLLFVSLAERYAEVVADAEINRHVEQQEWNAIVGILIDHCRRKNIADGFVAAIERTGPLLASRFPPPGDDTNELDDHLVEL